jgi:hypothetical protein
VRRFARLDLFAFLLAAWKPNFIFGVFDLHNIIKGR